MNNDIVKGFDEEREESLKIRIEKIERLPNCLAVHLTGYIDAYNNSYFQRKATMAVEAGFTRLIFDMRGVNFIGSTGVGGLVFLLKTVKSKSGDMVLQEMQPKVYEVLQLLGFSQFFALTNGLEESLAHFSQKPPTSVFPRVFPCPICAVKLRAGRAGRFRCSQCRTILALADTGAVSLG
ncbi:MAG: STAS domain-containing protein [Spirochaetes bacterium]|nr:STAS domain-containing protein [Spirochaetota bacterium]